MSVHKSAQRTRAEGGRHGHIGTRRRARSMGEPMTTALEIIGGVVLAVVLLGGMLACLVLWWLLTLERKD